MTVSTTKRLINASRTRKSGVLTRKREQTSFLLATSSELHLVAAPVLYERRQRRGGVSKRILSLKPSAKAATRLASRGEEKKRHRRVQKAPAFFLLPFHPQLWRRFVLSEGKNNTVSSTTTLLKTPPQLGALGPVGPPSVALAGKHGLLFPVH